MTVGLVLKSLLIAGITAYAVVVAVVYFAQRSLLFPGASHSAMPVPAPWGERIAIVTPDGETLAALHRAPPESRPTVLFFGGNGDNVAAYGFLADDFAAHGYGLLALSYRGYPGSTGSPSESGLLIDSLAGFDWLAARNGGPIVLLGRSLGTGVAVATASERNAAALVLVSPYESVLSLARGRFAFLPVSLLIRDSFRSDLRIATVAEPKLFLHGDLDNVVPMASGEALFVVAPEPKTFQRLEGRHHNDVWSEALVAEIVAFVDKNLGGASE